MSYQFKTWLKSQAELQNLRDRVLSEVEKDSFITLPGKGGNSEAKWSPVWFLGMEAYFFIPHFLVDNARPSLSSKGRFKQLLIKREAVKKPLEARLKGLEKLIKIREPWVFPGTKPGGLGLIPGQGTRFHMLQLNIQHAATKTEDPVCCD